MIARATVRGTVTRSAWPIVKRSFPWIQLPMTAGKPRDRMDTASASAFVTLRGLTWTSGLAGAAAGAGTATTS